eukprot:s2913_g4.t1
MPSELSLRFAEFAPTWRHRAVSKTWHRTIIRMRLKQALDPKETWSMTQLLRVSCSYFEGGSDYLARRLKLGPPCEELSGTAEAILLQGNVDGPEPCELARGEGCYRCEMHKEQAMLRIQLVRVSGVGAGPDRGHARTDLGWWCFVHHGGPDSKAVPTSSAQRTRLWWCVSHQPYLEMDYETSQEVSMEKMMKVLAKRNVRSVCCCAQGKRSAAFQLGKRGT